MSARNEPRLDILSIGTLARNLLWQENQPTRTPHATTSLIRAGDKTIVVDPGLPEPALAARLGERANVRPADVDIVFLTTLLPAHRAGITLFPNAKWLADEAELTAVAGHLKMLAERSTEGGEDMPEPLRLELLLLGKMNVAEGDQLAEGVDLYPLHGATPGTCGLLVQERIRTTLVTGPAVATKDHLFAGQVLPDAASVAAAQESLRDVFEIADLIVPAYDNLFVSPRQATMFDE